ncbi:MAG TPA: HNH endonuclease [Candidatus Saccharimonadales bacterium]|nr:HNH endonuclease [Candidatus Saccharimonadales bacterium]
MPKNRSWEDEALVQAVKESFSIRMVIQKLGLIPAGGNYQQVKRRIAELTLDITHFTGMGWNTGVRKRTMVPALPIEELLVENSLAQSYKLKNRLFLLGLKEAKCELCGWAERSPDGRIPVELDHINGTHSDNRLENLRILCPNCHSLQPTHRGKNKRVKLRNVTH